MKEGSLNQLGIEIQKMQRSKEKFDRPTTFSQNDYISGFGAFRKLRKTEFRVIQILIGNSLKSKRL